MTRPRPWSDAGVVAAVTELGSIRIQDNFSIPVVTAWVVLAVQWLLGSPLGF